MNTEPSPAQAFETRYAQVAAAVAALETRRIVTWVGAVLGFLVVTQVGIQISAAMSAISWLAPIGVVFVLAGVVAGGGGAVWLVWRTNRDLPDLLFRAIASGLGLTLTPGGPSEPSLYAIAPLKGDRAILGHVRGNAEGRNYGIAFVQDTVGLGRSRYTAYQGFLVSVDYPVEFPARVLLLRDGAGGAGTGLQDVGLVDARFERRFGVWSDDQIEARVLLDPPTIEEILHLEQQIGEGRMQCAFGGRSVQAAIRTVNVPSGRDAWPNMGRAVNQKDRIRTLAWDLFWAARLAGELQPPAAWLRKASQA